MGCEICSLKIRLSMDNFKFNDRRSLCRTQTVASIYESIAWNRLEGPMRE